MVLSVEPELVPLREDEHGAIRVGNTRVLMELVVHLYLLGANAEQIVDSFPSLDLADVYLVLGYYLRHREEIDAYLRRQEEHAEQVRREAEARWDQAGLRERLLARAAEKGQ